MLGGAPRHEPAALAYREQGPAVNHFNYFRNPSSAAQLVNALQGDLSRFQPVAAVAAVTRGIRRGTGPRPVVFVLPGITGSHLALGNNRI